MYFQGIPTLIIAVSGIDDAASVAGYGILKSIMFSHDALWYQILQGPIAIIGGLGFGIMWGWLAKYVPEKGDVSIFSLFSTKSRIKNYNRQLHFRSNMRFISENV